MADGTHKCCGRSWIDGCACPPGPHEDDLVSRVARAIFRCDFQGDWDEAVIEQCWQDASDDERHIPEAEAAIEASGITDLTRQLAEARAASEKGMAINSQNCRGFAKWQAETAALNPEQTK